MYDYLFWFFYKFFEWRKGFKSPLIASAMVGLVILIHIGLIHSIVRYFTGFTIGVFSNSYGYNRLILLPVVILWFYFLYHFFYRKRADKILESRKENKFSEPKNIIFVILLIVVPLIIAIRLTNIAISNQN
ncbi:MAG: hypothetical protein BGO52_13760 [Sphingobacteriales bacterium 44-61]|nr:MAG: hypothetical protein BGO52_13760 [Sphingobacteriales bacterium 44-61]